MIAQGASLWVDCVEDSSRHADHALAMRYQHTAVPGQEELPVGGIPASAPAPEEPGLLHKNTSWAQLPAQHTLHRDPYCPQCTRDSRGSISGRTKDG